METLNVKTARNVFTAFVLCLAFVASLGATNTYTQTVTSVTTVTITGATHGLGCSTFGVRFYSGGVRRDDLISGAPSKNAGNYNVTINFTSTVSGDVDLQGCFTAPTTASTDFEVAIGVNNNTLDFCSACSDSTPAIRLYNSYNYVGVASYSLGMAGDQQTGTVYVWLDPATGLLNYGTTTTGGIATPGGSGTKMTRSVSGYPSGVLQLAHATYAPLCVGMVCSNSILWSLTNDRPSF